MLLTSCEFERAKLQQWPDDKTMSKCVCCHSCCEGRVEGDKDLKGARPVPGPTMMIGVPRSLGSLKSGFLATYTGT